MTDQELQKIAEDASFGDPDDWKDRKEMIFNALKQVRNAQEEKLRIATEFLEKLKDFRMNHLSCLDNHAVIIIEHQAIECLEKMGVE